MKKTWRDCDCLWCNSRCPECEETGIIVQFTIQGFYINDQQDAITVEVPTVHVSVQCEKCGAVTEGHNEDWLKNENDGQLKKLVNIVKDWTSALPGNLTVEMGEDGLYHTKEYKITGCDN